MGMIKKGKRARKNIYLFISLYIPVVLPSCHASKVEWFKKWSVAVPLSSYVKMFPRGGSMGESVTIPGCQCFLLHW